MNIVEPSDAPYPTTMRTPTSRWRRPWRLLLAIFTAQYTIIAIMIGVSLAATLRYVVTPEIAAKFEAITAALKH
jgi:hypothetical protein